MDSTNNNYSSEEEPDHHRGSHPLQGNNLMGIARSYECVFCKRGFTTAQALGGHMNIHRKDRANKTRRPVSVSTKLVHNDHQQILSYTYPTTTQQYYSVGIHPRNDHHGGGDHDDGDDDEDENRVHVNYQTFFPVPFPRAVVDEDYDMYMRNSSDLKSYGGEDWRASLSLQIGDTSRVVEDDDNERSVAGNLEEAGNRSLDLELRLGYDRY